MDDTAGVVEAIRFNCTNGNASEWYGDAEGWGVGFTFGVGLTSIKSREVMDSSALLTSTEVDSPFMGMLYVEGYDLSQLNGSVSLRFGPFG